MNRYNPTQNKLRPIGCLLASTALMLSTASAKLIVYEGFEYERRQWTETGAEAEGLEGLDGGYGWASPWLETEAPLNGIAAEEQDVTGEFAGARTKALSYTDSLGNQLITEPGQARLINNSYSIRALPSDLNVPGTSAWISFLAQGQDNSETGFAFLGLKYDGSTGYRIRLGKINATTANWGIQSRNTPSSIATGPATSETVFYLLRLDFPQNTAEQIGISIWFNPDLANEGGLGEPDIATATNNTVLNQVKLRGRLSIDVDEIRIGTTFASVTPHGPFQENLSIARAVTVNFNTEAGKEYEIQSSSDGQTWQTVLSHLGDGQPFESALNVDPSQENIRVILSSEPWTPNSESTPTLSVTDGLRLHLDASAAESLTTEGLRVTEWRDTSGNDILFTPSQLDPWVDTRPVFWTSGPNNRPVLMFDQSSLESQSPAALGLANDVEGITFFAVGQNMQSGAQNIFRMNKSDGSSTRFVQYRTGGRNAMQVRRLDEDADTISLSGGERVSSVWGIDASVIDFMNANYYLYRDGEEIAFAEGLGTTGRSSPTDSTVVRIGSSTTTDLRNDWQGDIAEMLFYNRPLTREERNEVGKYLSDKYGLPYRLALEEPVPFTTAPTVNLTFTAEGEKDYQIESTEDLTSTWNDLGSTIPGVGFNERTFITIDGVDREFYRLRKQQTVSP